MLLSIGVMGMAQKPINQKQFKVKVKPQSNQRIATAAKLKSTSVDNTVQTGIQSLDLLNVKYSATTMVRLFKHAGKYEQKHIDNGLHLWYVITVNVNNETEMLQCIQDYNINPDIEIAEPFINYQLIKPIEQTPIKEKSEVINNSTFPDDPDFNKQWHYHNTGQEGGTAGADIDLKRAWEIETGDTSVIVAIIDGGVQASHPDLAASMWTNYAEKNGQPDVDDDNNGYIDDIHGYNFESEQSTISPGDHGCHVAGIIAGVSNNGNGIAGIAGGDGTGNGARLMTCDVFGESGIFFSESGGFENAFVYAADNGAVIAQNSWGSNESEDFDQSIKEAIDYFIANAGYDENNNPRGPMQGGLVVFAAGNDNSDVPYYPGSYNKVIAVAATNKNDNRSYFSNYGYWVDVAAPGENVYSTYSTGEYGLMSGTSMACPHVSGLAALIISHFKNDNIKPENVKDRIMYLSDNIEPQNRGFENMLGGGRINAFMALQPSDSVAPASINNLAATSSGRRTLDLKWTSTGSSNDTGTASRYELRYSFEMITNENFDDAHEYYPVNRPKATGIVDSFRLTQLIPDTTYYLALKVIDAFSNKSEISNVASIRTLTAPTIHLSELEVNEDLNPQESVSRKITITNTGKDTLVFRTDFANADPISERNETNSSESLIEKANPPLFTIDRNLKAIVQLNHLSGEIISQIPFPLETDQNDMGGMAFDGEYFYVTKPKIVWEDSLRAVYVLNTLGSIVDSVMVDVRGFSSLYIISALGVVNGKLYVLNNQSALIQEIDIKTGKRVRHIQHDIVYPWGMTGASNRNSIFVSREGIEEIDLTTGEVINSFLKPKRYIDLAYSNSSKLLFALHSFGDHSHESWEKQIDAIDPNTGEILNTFDCTYKFGLCSDESFPDRKWLTVTNVADTLFPGEQTILDMSINSDSLHEGIYTDFIPVYSNDPYTPGITIPVTLNVKNDLVGYNPINKSEQSLIIYPNPATDFINIQGENLFNSSIAILDLQGKEIYKSVITCDKIDISNLPKGIYMIKVSDNKHHSITKFIKK